MSTEFLEITLAYFAKQIGWFNSEGSNLVSILGAFWLFLPLREVEVSLTLFKMSGFQFLSH